MGERLRAAREAAGFQTMKAAALEADMAFSTFHNYESSRSYPGAEAIAQLCRAFGISSDWLLGL